jgi:hypothetical protein
VCGEKEGNLLDPFFFGDLRKTRNEQKFEKD